MMDPVDDGTAPIRGTYAAHALAYWRAGWYSPLPSNGKHIMHAGYTGRGGRIPTMGDIVNWTIEHPNHNIALRCPPDVIGIDVDAYDNKHGDQTLTLAEQQWGPLPPTWITTSRDGTISGIRWYRKPEAIDYIGIIELDGHADIEIIQHHHRYGIAPPSIHPGTRNPYRWINPQGHVSIDKPGPDQLPFLPERWHHELTKPQTTPDHAHPPVEWPKQQADRSQWHHRVLTNVQTMAEIVVDNPGSRHDRALTVTLSLVRQERLGYPGATTAIGTITDLWIEHMTEPRGGQRFAAQEIGDMLKGAYQKVAVTANDLTDQEIRDYLGAGQPAQTTPQPEPDDNPHLVNIQQWLTGNIQETLPDFLQRDDGQHIFYTGQLNWMHGDSGSGKTWVALMGAAQTLNNGGRIIWVHYEDPTPRTILTRLQTLGLDHQTLIDRFHYWTPIGLGLTDKQQHQWLTQTCQTLQPDMIILDSIGEAMGADGISEDKDEYVGPWLTKTLRHLVNNGHGVIGIDHMTKEGAKTDDLNPSGSKRKRAAITGHSVLVKALTPPTKTTAGTLALICAKDRHGNYAARTKIAEIQTKPVNNLMQYTINNPHTVTLTDEIDRAERLIRAVVRAVHDTPGIVLRDLTDQLPQASKQARYHAVEQALKTRRIVEQAGERRSRKFFLPTQEDLQI